MNILNTDPVDWREFIRMHRMEPKKLSSIIKNSSLSEVLNHFPPPIVVHELIEAHHDEIIDCPTALIKFTLLSACATSCFEVIELIAKEVPQILELEIDLSGDIPLHRARSLETASILLHAYPQGIGRINRKGDLPLHTAVIEHRNVDLVRSLLQEGVSQLGESNCGGIFVRNRDGKTPLSLLYAHFRNGPVTTPLYGIDVRLWETLKSFIMVYDWQQRTVNVFRDEMMFHEEAMTTSFLHHLLTLQGPENVVELCIAADSATLGQIDVNGRVAISRIAGDRQYSKEILRLLLKYCPHMASVEDRSRRLPLHWAVACGRDLDDGLIDILNAYPSAVSLPDNDGLYPFTIAALNLDCSIDITYLLLREAPEVISHCLGR
jgi:hypothetical protein